MRFRNRFRFTLVLPFLFLISFTYPVFSADGHSPISGSENADPVLTDKINDLIKNFEGDVGIYVRHLSTGRMAAIRADELFPTASMIKVPILMALFDKIQSGKLKYLDGQVYRDSLLYAGEDILGSFKDGEKISLSKLVLLMITTSDNTASLWCQNLAGTGTEINRWLSDNGFEKTRVNSRTAGRKKDWEKFGWGQTTPREMAEMLVLIRDGKAVSKAASMEMYRVLCNIYWNGEALSQIPPYVQAASKQGAVSDSRSETVLVNAPSGDYVFSIITKNQKNKSWQHNNDGLALIRKTSKLLWEYFEPGSDWEPVEGAELWAK